jgi:ubiquinone biosynthesis protein
VLLYKFKRLAQLSFFLGTFLFQFLGLKILPMNVRSRALSKMSLPEDFGPILLRRTLEGLGGMYIKLGQILAMRFDYLPASYCLELFKLLDKVPPFETEKAKKIIKDEIGKNVCDFAEDFNPEPIASASFGQVYTAKINNKRVIIKVQRPEIEQIIKTDLVFLSILVRFIDLTTIFGKITLWPLFEDLRETTLVEIDYRKEAHNAIKFKENNRESNTASSPEVYLEYSTRRILVMEQLEGIWMNDFLKELEHTSEQSSTLRIERLAKNLLNNTLKQVFEDGYFHADPHPANLLILPEAVIGYVDFGIVGHISDEYQTKMLNYFLSLSNRDIPSAYKNFLFLIQPPSNKDLIHLEKEFKKNVSEWFDMIDSNGGSSSQRSSTRLLLRNIEIIRRHNLGLPKVVINFYRTLATVDILFSRLAPQLNILTEMKKALLEILFRKRILHESPDKAIQLLLDYHELVHAIPNTLNLVIKLLEAQNRTRPQNPHRVDNFLSLVSAFLFVFLVGFFVFHSPTILNELYGLLFVSSKTAYTIAITFILLLQWARRLLSRRY